MDDRDVERATQEISNDIKEGQWKIREYNMIWKSDLKTLREFAVGIKRDKEAVQNAMDIYLNNGVLERTVNKTKAIKRQMFNRANITLLVNKLISLNTWTAPKLTKIQVFPISSVTVSLISFYQLIFNLFD